MHSPLLLFVLHPSLVGPTVPQWQSHMIYLMLPACNPSKIQSMLSVDSSKHDPGSRIQRAGAG